MSYVLIGTTLYCVTSMFIVPISDIGISSIFGMTVSENIAIVIKHDIISHL